MFKQLSENPHFNTVKDLMPSELESLMKDGNSLKDVKLIDVRQPEEYVGELGHIANAELIPLGTLPGEMGKFKPDDQIVFICKSGGRSAQASEFARQNGFANTYNLSGGMLQWNQLGFPVIK